MKYTYLRDFIQTEVLLGTDWEEVAFLPGPDESNAPPGRYVLLTRIGGPGLTMEYLFDAVGWQVAVVGDQNDYEDAEDLALAIDEGLVMAGSQTYEDKRILSIVRQGSPPSPVLNDDGDRTRFVCSYIVEIESYAA